MVVPFNHEGMIVTIHQSSAVQASNLNATSMATYSPQFQQVHHHIKPSNKGTYQVLGVIRNIVMTILSTVAAAVGIICYAVFLGGPLFYHKVWFNSIALVACLLAFNIFEFIISIIVFSMSCYGPGCCTLDYKPKTFMFQSATTQNHPAPKPQDVNYETLLSDCSVYESLEFK